MKIAIIVETPDDDDLAWPRVARALEAYNNQVAANHMAEFGERLNNVGCDGGPNKLVVRMAAGAPLVVTEVRFDGARVLWRIWDALPWWLRWTVSWALPA